jgi:hypothetical protein
MIYCNLSKHILIHFAFVVFSLFSKCDYFFTLPIYIFSYIPNNSEAAL